MNEYQHQFKMLNDSYICLDDKIFPLLEKGPQYIYPVFQKNKKKFLVAFKYEITIKRRYFNYKKIKTMKQMYLLNLYYYKTLNKMLNYAFYEKPLTKFKIRRKKWISRLYPLDFYFLNLVKKANKQNRLNIEYIILTDTYIDYSTNNLFYRYKSLNSNNIFLNIFNANIV